MTENTGGNREELVNDLVAVVTVMEELWRYHPDNISKINIVEAYDEMVKIQQDIEIEIANLDK
tara:strand:+ start:180 stop:368 length:189 start_codon:yes stop_codon:yes gene_type:complete